MILYVLGWVLRIEAMTMLLPVLCGLIYHESVFALTVTAVLSFASGLAVTITKPKRTDFYAREGFAMCALCWIVMSLVGALPFYISGTIPSYLDAVFEIVSGFTTTGASILSEVESLGKGLLFWRSFSHWVGGMGVLVLVLTVLPLGSGYNMMIMKAESPGPDVSKMVPRVKDTAIALYKIYFFLTVVMIIVYLCSGMDAYDAICIGFGTAGTGGFAVRNSGMADYSMLSQAFITLFMILFGVNFNVYYLLQRKRFRDALHSEEVRLYLIIILSAVILITLNIIRMYNGDWLYVIHHTFFTCASLITTTGFGTEDFVLWPQFSQMLLLGLMFCGACAGSTGGGIKVSRFIIACKEIGKELLVLIHPEAVKKIRLEGKSLEHQVVRSVNCYLIMYIVIYTVSLLILSLDNFDFTTTFSAVSATFNNIGPGLGLVGPTANYSLFSPLSKIVLIFDMLAGRLEILPMLVLFLPNTWHRMN